MKGHFLGCHELHFGGWEGRTLVGGGAGVGDTRAADNREGGVGLWERRFCSGAPILLGKGTSPDKCM